MNGLLAKEHSCGRTQRKFRHNKLVNSFVGSASAGGISFEHAGKRSESPRSAQIRFWRFARFDYGACCRSARRVALRPRPTRRRLSRREAAVARAVSDFRAEEQAKSKLAQRAKKEAEAMGMASASDAAASTPPLSTLMSMPKPSEPPL